MIGIFHCADVPFISLWWGVRLNLLLILKWGCLFIDLQDSLHMFAEVFYKLYILWVLSVFGLPFHFYHSDFDKVQMIIFPVYILYSYVLVRKSLLNKSPLGVSLTVSSKTITVIVPIMFVSVIHFEYIFNVGYGSFWIKFCKWCEVRIQGISVCVCVWHMDIHLFQYYFLKILSFHYWIALATLLKV